VTVSIRLRTKKFKNKCISAKTDFTCTALGYGLDDRGSRVRFPAGAGNFCLHHRVQNGSWAHPASYSVGTRGYFPGSKVTGAWSWSLAPSSAEVKNEWRYTSTLPICLHGVVLT